MRYVAMLAAGLTFTAFAARGWPPAAFAGIAVTVWTVRSRMIRDGAWGTFWLGEDRREEDPREPDEPVLPALVGRRRWWR